MRQIKIENMPTLPYEMEEAINRLRVNISFLGSGVKKILVVSAVPNEGKSFVAMQLWRQMAMTDTKSVLLDADLRNSTLVERYGITATDGDKLFGTSHYLLGEQELDNMLAVMDESGSVLLPNVYNVVNPSILIENERFDQMMQTLGEQFRYVFVDAPPLEVVSDAELIGSMCDGAILVVRGGSTSKHQVRRTISQLERSGCPLLGIVLNRVGGSDGKYYHNRYGHKYYKGKYYGKYYGKHS
jgi:capsular exopolysaccharide synthesis family protein